MPTISPATRARRQATTPLPPPNVSNDAWKNPAAAAAMKSSTDILKGVEDGIVRNFSDVNRVRAYVSDLASSSDMFSSAQQALTADKYPENDAFVPIIDKASGGVLVVAKRLGSQDIVNTWPAERNDILSAIRQSKSISANVAQQLDPNTVE